MLKLSLLGLRFLPLSALLLALLVGATAFNSTNGSSLNFMRIWGGKLGAGALAVTIDSSGSIYVTGSATGFGATAARVFLLKYSSNGSLLWQKVWGGNGGEVGAGVAVDSVKSVYVTGITNSFNALHNDQFFLLKLDSSGNMVWQKAWVNFSMGKAVSVGPDGNVYVAGCLCNISKGTEVLALLRIDPNGRIVWQKEYTENGTFTEGLGLALDSSSNIYVTGGGSLLLKVNSTGILQWQSAWHNVGATQEVGTRVAADSQGNTVVGGYSCYCPPIYGSGSYVYNLTFSRFNLNGTLLWQRSWVSALTGTSSPYASAIVHGVALDGSGNIFATGKANGAFLLMLNSSGALLPSSSIVQGPIIANGVTVDLFSTPVVVGTIGGPPSSFHSTTLSPTIDARLPMLITPTGTLRDLNYSLVNITGTMSDVQGNTTYTGGDNVFMNYGSAFAVSILTPIQVLPIALPIILLVRRKITRTRYRSRVPMEA